MSLKRSRDMGLPLSTPAMNPFPSTWNCTRLSALGHRLPSLSSISTVTKLRSVPLLFIVLQCGVKGRICGIKIEEIEDPRMKDLRILDKLVDDLAKGKTLDKIIGNK